MQRILLAASAIGIAATLATSDIALSQGTMVCRPGGRCLTTSAVHYNHCADLALRRGTLPTRGDRYNFDLFVFDCVANRIGGLR